MSITLKNLLPNISNSLDGTGFLFGAGTSREAGYPMMAGLTRQVIALLSSSERTTLNDILTVAGTAYDDAHAIPNIEELSDLVIAHGINTRDSLCLALEDKLRELIVECLLSVSDPILDLHCRFFKALKDRTFGRPCTVWIFTTNYDLLFEIGAARVGVVVENGFCGATERFFSPHLFRSVSGDISGGRFAPSTMLTVKLVKLHGSISWVRDGSGVLYERHPAAHDSTSNKVMVLPRRKKVMDTLAEPYNVLFSEMRRVLGAECKYLVSCGFSYADEHINQHLLLPALKSNWCRLFALSETQTPGMAALQALPSFSGGFAGDSWIDGKASGGGTDLWQFGKFVTLFE